MQTECRIKFESNLNQNEYNLKLIQIEFTRKGRRFDTEVKKL